MLTFALMEWVFVSGAEPERSGPKSHVSGAERWAGVDSLSRPFGPRFYGSQGPPITELTILMIDFKCRSNLLGYKKFVFFRFRRTEKMDSVMKGLMGDGAMTPINDPPIICWARSASGGKTARTNALLIRCALLKPQALTTLISYLWQYMFTINVGRPYYMFNKILLAVLRLVTNEHIVWRCLWQNYVFLGTIQGPTLFIYNKTNFSDVGLLSFRNITGSVTDIATYSVENQPQSDSKQVNWT